MRVLLGMVCAVTLSACSTVERDDPPADEPALGVVDSTVLQCTFGCGTGSHPVAYSCGFSCPGSGACSSGYNQTDCVADTGSSFNACGIFGCPSGYHATSYQFLSSCKPSPAAPIDRNQQSCSQNTSSFFMCGLGCPAGYRPISTSFKEACKPSGSSGNSNNQTFCSL